MKPFPYDEFYPVFMEELKTIFSQFIEQNRDKKPYIFALTVREWMSFNYFECYHLDANGNTAVDFESQEIRSPVFRTGPHPSACTPYISPATKK